MQQIRYIHWNPTEAKERAIQIQLSGYEVDHSQISPTTLKVLRDNPPAAIVIDLERLPAQGRDLGITLRGYKSTRHVPLVFVGGKKEKVKLVKELLPDAVYTQWGRINVALKRAIENPTKEPVVHRSAFAGYSGTPLPKKLGIKDGSTVLLVGAPREFEKKLGELPANVTFCRRATAGCDLTIWFTRSTKDLERRIEKLGMSAGEGGIWVVWPKKSSGEKTDLTQAEVRRIGLASALVDYKVCSVDSTWTGLRFTRRTRK
jgi:hypothetical protein